MIGELTKTLKVTQEQVCIMAALLGNFLLPESDLQDLYKKLGLTKVPADNVSTSSCITPIFLIVLLMSMTALLLSKCKIVQH